MRAEPHGVAASHDRIVDLLAQTFAQSSLGVCYFDPERIIRWANAVFATQIGMPHERLIGERDETVMPGWTAQFGSLYDQIRETGTGWHDEAFAYVFPEQPKRGTTFWSSSVTPLHSPSGEFQGWLLIQNEVTQQVRSERRIEQLLDLTQQQNEKLSLQAEALTTTNLRLQVQSEQLQTQSEELQSQHEELQTQSEELQSQHEELQVQSEELRAANEALTRAHDDLARFAAIVESSEDAIIGKTLDGVITSWNRAAERLYGYTTDQAIGQPIAMLVPKDRPDELPSIVERLRHGERIDHYETVRVRQDGSQLDVSITVSPINDARGQIVGASTIARDVSARKRIEEERAQLLEQVQAQNEELQTQSEEIQTQSEEIQAQNEELRAANEAILQASEASYRLAAIVESSDDAIIGKTVDGIITSWNKAAERLYGYSADEMIGRPISVLVSSDHHDELPAILERVTRGERVESYESVRMRKGGGLVEVSLTVSPVKDDAGQIVGASTIARDITQHKHAQREIERLNADLQKRAAALSAVNRELEAFSYSVSHDLRAPLRSIDGFSQALLEDYQDKLDGRGKHYLQRVRAASQQMAQLIDDLLALSRITRGEVHRESVDLSALAREIAQDLRRTQPERMVELVIAPNVVAHGDARLLKVALVNLLGNAWKFTAKHAGARIEFGVTRHEGQATYFVRDDGAGFDMAFAGKLFGAFQRLHQATEFPGSGIGLATVQRIVHRHGGRVWAEGAVEQGATFYFTLEGADGQDVER